MRIEDFRVYYDVDDESRVDDLILTRDGHAVALVMPFDDDDLEWYARERDPEFLNSIARAREQVKTGRQRLEARPRQWTGNATTRTACAGTGRVT